MEIRMDDQNRVEACRHILDALPQWFGIASAKEEYVRAVQDLPTLTCLVDNQTVGFAILKKHKNYSIEIYCMGVLPQWHRRGVGRTLLHGAERYLRERCIKFLTVKTLAESVQDDNYRATRCFYRALGFLPLEEFPYLWGPSNPCLMLIKCIEMD